MFEKDGLIIGVLTIVIADLLLKSLFSWNNKRMLKKTQREEIKLKYLNPLRLYAVELHHRWEHTLGKVDNQVNDSKSLESLRYIKKASEIMDIDSKWFYEKGYYLISTSYLISCFLAQYYMFKFHLPILYMNHDNYILLSKSLKKFNNKFRDTYEEGTGIYDVIQYDIGQNMYASDFNNIISYSDYCKRLKDPVVNGGLLRLVNFCIDSVKEHKVDILKALYQALGDLIKDLDTIIESEIKSNDIIKSQVLR